MNGQMRVPGGVCAMSPRERLITTTKDFETVNAWQASKIASLTCALTDLLERYTGLINSGDCGSWDPEQEREVVAARASLAMRLKDA